MPNNNNNNKENDAIFVSHNFEIATATTTRSASDPEDLVVDDPTSESIIRGIVYNDANQNGRRDNNDNDNDNNDNNDNNNNNNDNNNSSSEETGVARAVVKLFACSTGYGVATTRTDDDGSYSFVIPSNELLGKADYDNHFNNNDNDNNDNNNDVGPRVGCYYIQYTISKYIAPDAQFTTPRNGETSNLYLSPGEELSHVNAGVVLAEYTPAPTPGYWGSVDAMTWSPTSEEDGWSLAVGSTGIEPPSPAPYVIIDIDDRRSASPTASTETGLLPLPSETVASSSSAASAEEDEEEGLKFGSDPTTTAIATVGVILPLPADTVVLATTRAPTTMAPTPAPVENAATDDDNAVAWSATSPTTAATSGIDNEVVVDDVDDEGASSKSEPTPSGIVRPVVGGKEEGATSVRGGVGSDDETPEDETPGGTKEGSSERPDGESSLVASSDGGTTTKDDDEEDEASGNSTVRADDEGDDDDDDDDDGILSLDATVRIALSNLPSTMHPDAQYIFETMCSEFLNDQLTYATPPIFDVECIVVGQSLEEDDRRRNRRLRRHRESVVAPQHHHHPHGSISSSSSSLRYLASSTTHSRLTVEAQITGSVETTQPSARRMNDDKFATLLIGTFNVQGYIFAEMLKEAEENEATTTTTTTENFESNSTTATVATTTTSEYYRTVGEVRGMEVDGVDSGEGDYDDDADDDGGDTVFTKGVVAAIGVGGVVVALASMLLFARKARRRRGERKGRGTAVAGGKSGVRRSGVVGGGGGARKSNPGNGASAVATRRKVAEPSSSSLSAANNIPSMKTIPSTSPTNTTSTSASSPTFTSTSSTTGTTTKTNTNTTNTTTTLPSPRVRREVLAPAGKLGIMVANAKGIAGRGGPTVHTIRPGSPMEGMIYVNDVIVGVNDVDTRTFTANDMTRLIKDTAGEGRRIYVLSSARR